MHSQVKLTYDQLIKNINTLSNRYKDANQIILDPTSILPSLQINFETESETQSTFKMKFAMLKVLESYYKAYDKKFTEESINMFNRAVSEAIPVLTNYTQQNQFIAKMVKIFAVVFFFMAVGIASGGAALGPGMTLLGIAKAAGIMAGVAGIFSGVAWAIASDMQKTAEEGKQLMVNTFFPSMQKKLEDKKMEPQSPAIHESKNRF